MGAQAKARARSLFFSSEYTHFKIGWLAELRERKKISNSEYITYYFTEKREKNRFEVYVIKQTITIL